jgi:hypothetical protein
MACRTVLALECVARNNTATHYACQVRLRSWWRLTPKVIMRNYKHPLDALERLAPKWEGAVRDPHLIGGRQ